MAITTTTTTKDRRIVVNIDVILSRFHRLSTYQRHHSNNSCLFLVVLDLHAFGNFVCIELPSEYVVFVCIFVENRSKCKGIYLYIAI